MEVLIVNTELGCMYLKINVFTIELGLISVTVYSVISPSLLSQQCTAVSPVENGVNGTEQDRPGLVVEADNDTCLGQL